MADVNEKYVFIFLCDFVADLSPVLATVDFVASVYAYRALYYH